MNGSRESQPPRFTPRIGRFSYEPQAISSAGTFGFARALSSHDELRPERGRSPIVSVVKVQFMAVISSHVVGSIQVPAASSGISSASGHLAGVGGLDVSGFVPAVEPVLVSSLSELVWPPDVDSALEEDDPELT